VTVPPRPECTRQDSQGRSGGAVYSDPNVKGTIILLPADMIVDSGEYVQVTTCDVMTTPIEQMDGIVTEQNNQHVGPCAVCGHHIQYSDQQHLQHIQHIQHVTTIATLPGSYPAASSAPSPDTRSSTRMQWDQFFPSFFRSCDPREAWEVLQQGISELNSAAHRDSRRQVRDSDHHQDRYYKQKDHVRGLKHELDHQRRIFEEYQQQSDVRFKQAAETEQNLRTTIDDLRAQIFAIGSSRGPRQDGNYYTQGFDALNTVIEQGVLKLVRQGKQILSDSAPNEILASISALGKHGKKTARFLTESAYTIPALYTQGEMRLSLLRHVVALFLTHVVLEPYAMGISKECSDVLKCVELELLNKGTPLIS
jgi:hypothetical protein